MVMTVEEGELFADTERYLLFGFSGDEEIIIEVPPDEWDMQMLAEIEAKGYYNADGSMNWDKLEEATFQFNQNMTDADYARHLEFLIGVEADVYLDDGMTLRPEYATKEAYQALERDILAQMQANRLNQT